MKRVVFGYGSKTGTAAAICEEVYAVCAEADQEDKFDLKLPEELNDLTTDIIESTSEDILLVICCSSTGQGELPPNVAGFFEAIQGAELQHVQFVILCLGDSNYTSFMEGPHRLTKALIAAHAQLIEPLFEADDADTEKFSDVTDCFVDSSPQIIENWFSGEVEAVTPIFHQLSSTAQKAAQNVAMNSMITFVQTSSAELASAKLSIPKMPKPTFNLTFDATIKLEPEYDQFEQVHNNESFEPLNSPPYDCHVVSATRLTGRSAQKQCYEMILSMPESTRTEQDQSRELFCGDCVAIFTPNNLQEVKLVLGRLGGKNEMVRADGARKPNWFSEHSSLSNILQFGVELRSNVTKAMVGHLAANCEHAETKRRLSEFISREGRDEFRQLLQRQVTFLDLLVAFPNLNLQIESLTYLRRLQRRWYSIANYIDYSLPCEKVLTRSNVGRLVKVAFTQVSSPKDGLMTGQLARLCDSVNEKPEPTPLLGPRQERVIVHCRDPPPNNFRLISNPKTPILMIAAGSGIAPFIGFLEQWEAMGGEEATLIYGCRNDDSFLYKKKLNAFKDTKVLNGLHVAFSRVEPKKYVQDVIKEVADEVKSLIDRSGIIYICGDGSGMGLSIRNVFTEVLGKDQYLALVTEKRIREDLWR